MEAREKWTHMKIQTWEYMVTDWMEVKEMAGVTGMIFSLYLAISWSKGNFYDDGNVLSALVKVVAGSYT